MADVETFLTACDRQYADPAYRVEIVTLILTVMLAIPYSPGTPANLTSMARFATHTMLVSLLQSLLLDTGNILFPLSLRCFLAVLPFAPQTLSARVPLIMTIVGRASCWLSRPFVDAASARRDAVTETRPPNPSLHWSVETSDMEETTSMPANLVPDRIVRLLIVAVYNAWPSNAIAFLRDPVSYLKGKAIVSVYDVDWDEVWEQGLLAKRAGPLLRNFHLHPSLIDFTSATELADAKRWDKVDAPEFISRSHMLAHSELFSGDRFDLMEGEPLVVRSAATSATEAHETASDDGRYETVDEIARLRRETQLLKLEASFQDRVRKQYLYRSCPTRRS